MLAVVLAAALAVETPTQFDLVCEGTMGLVNNSTKEERSRPFDAHFRIDLDRGVWCGERCEATLPLGPVDATRIYLYGPVAGYAGHWIDRSTGRLESVRDLGSIQTVTTAQCRPAPFSGMPEPLF